MDFFDSEALQQCDNNPQGVIHFFLPDDDDHDPHLLLPDDDDDHDPHLLLPADDHNLLLPDDDDDHDSIYSYQLMMISHQLMTPMIQGNHMTMIITLI